MDISEWMREQEEISCHVRDWMRSPDFLEDMERIKEMFQDVTSEMKRQTRTQASRLSQQIVEMEKLLAEMRHDVSTISEYGPCAVRGVNERGLPEHMARIAAQMSKSTSALAMLADMTDAANAGTCEESGM